jgi:beta-lactamase regulating signal transducer with metallopeptidase domain/uncharacterized protein YnzC (UPF0291/DUF896 family)
MTCPMIISMTISMTISSTTPSTMHWISPITMRALGWTLLHFLWQGTALAALAAAAMACSRRSQVRYALGVGALILMFAAPLVTFFYAEQVYSQPSYSSVPGGTKSSPLVAAFWPTSTGRDVSSANGSSEIMQALPTAPLAGALPWLPAAWLVQAWLLGVTFFSLRTVAGFFLLERKRRLESNVVGERVLEICHALQDMLGLKRAIQYCECKWLQAPAVIGWFRPIVFLPVTALSGLSEEQLQTVIAHELAHIHRLDPFVNVFQVFVETVLFYHPAVWWLNQKIRVEREHCCDETAVALCGNAVEYARALTLMEEWRSAPILAMAANRGPLTERVVRVLGIKTLGAGMRGIGLTGSVLCLTAALVAGDALVGIAHPNPFQSAAAAQPAAQATAASVRRAASSAKPSAGQPAQGTAGQDNARQDQARQDNDQPTTAVSYIDGMKAAGLTDLTVDNLIALKTQDITPEYVRALQQEGFHPDVNALIAMRVQGITPEYIHDLHAAGLTPDQNEMIALKVQGADGEYYRQLVAAGIQPNVDSLIALKVQGVTPEYVRELHAAGLTANANEIIALKVQDVTPAYLKAMHDQGIDPRTDDAIAMRVQDVTPEYVRAIRALGLNPSMSELIAMKVQDVTPEYIKALQTAGFKVSVNEIISAKVQDVTPEFIDRAVKHGFKDLTLQKLIQLRQLGILDSKADL